VKRELKNARIAFKIINGDEAIPPTYQDITCHMIFDVKMEDFRCNAHVVAGRHTMDTPHAMMYAIIVSRESVSIAMTIDNLKDAGLKMADIENTQLTSPIRKIGPCSVLSLELRLGRGRSLCEHSIA
jgi:hypothetical protein